MITASNDAVRGQWRVVYLSVLAAGFAALSSGLDVYRRPASWVVGLGGIIVGTAGLQIRIALRQDPAASARSSAALWRALAVLLFAIAVGFVTLGALAVWRRVALASS